MDVFADQAFYNQPHNVYFYMLLQFGLVGFVWILALLGYAWQRGWQWRKAGLMQREPLLGALWITLLGYFLIGMVESNLMGIESRMIFLWVLAFFLGLGRELSSNRHGNPDKSSETQGQKETSEGLSYSQ
jgi:O-antigen ligase